MPQFRSYKEHHDRMEAAGIKQAAPYPNTTEWMNKKDDENLSFKEKMLKYLPFLMMGC